MPEQIESFDALVRRIGAIAHTRLVQHRALTQTTPYIKKTLDQTWITRHGTEYVDLALCLPDDLPSDWQEERNAGAKIALEAVHEAQQHSMPLDEDFIEKTAAVLHDAWLKRNSHRANTAQTLAYMEMSESEKEKDRIFVHAAIEVAS